MPRSKKTRKVGLIGVRKDPDRKPRVTVPQGKKKGKGKPSGTRNALEQQKTRSGGKKAAQDPRHGSKRPIQLIKAETRKYASPAEELAALEADNKLAALLDKLDQDISISRTEQQYVDEKMERHRVLCDLMGISDNEDEDDDSNDPLDDLDAISMDDFKK